MKNKFLITITVSLLNFDETKIRQFFNITQLKRLNLC
jgi:hypothetical protein